MDFIVENHRIYAADRTGRIMAEVTFPAVSADTVDINHTYVDESLRGRGTAGELMKAVAEKLRLEHKKTRASCPYAARWFEHHPEYADVFITG